MPPAHAPLPSIASSGGFEDDDDDGASSSSSLAGPARATAGRAREPRRRRGGELDRATLDISSTPPPVRAQPSLPPLVTAPAPAPAHASTLASPSSGAPRRSFTRWRGRDDGPAPASAPVVRKKLFSFARSELASPAEPGSSRPNRTSLGLLGRRSSWAPRTKAHVPPMAEAESRAPPATTAPSLAQPPDAQLMSARTNSERSVASTATGSSHLASSRRSTDDSATSVPSATPSEAPAASHTPDRRVRKGQRAPSPTGHRPTEGEDSTPEGTVVSSANLSVDERQEQHGRGLSPRGRPIPGTTSQALAGPPLHSQDSHDGAGLASPSPEARVSLSSVSTFVTAKRSVSADRRERAPDSRQATPSVGATSTASTPIAAHSSRFDGMLPQPDTSALLPSHLPRLSLDPSTPSASASFASESSVRSRSHSPAATGRPSVSPRLPSSIHTTPSADTPEPVSPQPASPAVPLSPSSPLLPGHHDGLKTLRHNGAAHLGAPSSPITCPTTGPKSASPPHRPARSPARRSQTLGRGSAHALSSPTQVVRAQTVSPTVARNKAADARSGLAASQAIMQVTQINTPSVSGSEVTGPSSVLPALPACHGQDGGAGNHETMFASRTHPCLSSPPGHGPDAVEQPRLATPTSSWSEPHSVATPSTDSVHDAAAVPHLTLPLPMPPPSAPKHTTHGLDSCPTHALAPAAQTAPPSHVPLPSSLGSVHSGPNTLASTPETIATTDPELHSPMLPETQVPLGALSRKPPVLASPEQPGRRFVKPRSPFSPGSAPTRENALPAMAWATIESALPKFQTAHSRSNAMTFERGKLLRMVLQPFLRMEQNRPLVRPDAPPSAPGSASDVSSAPPSPGVSTVALSPLSAMSQPTPSTLSVDTPMSACAPQPRPKMGEQAYERFSKARNRRALLHDWISELLEAIKTAHSSSDRLAILESISMLLEARNFSEAVFDAPETPDSDRERYHDTLYRCLVYALTELNKKGVYHNNLIFAGRLLAHALFRIPCVGEKLLCALPVTKASLDRVAREARWDGETPVGEAWDSYVSVFPAHLRIFCFQDAGSYLARVAAEPAPKVPDEDTGVRPAPRTPTYLVQHDGSGIQMSGNWLRRWQSDDSEVVFSFYRNFHRQLDRLIQTSLPPDAHALYFGAPAYAHIAASIQHKCLSLVHRSLNSVTTQQSQATFNPGETANVLLGSSNGKPSHLDTATARCVSAVVDSVTYGEPRTSPRQPHLFIPSIQLHLSCLIKRTSLYDVQGVFCLWDWIDALMEQIALVGLSIPRVIDLGLVISVARQILLEADHAVALMRTLAFCYGNFGLLMSTVPTREALADDTLLSPPIFTKLFLSWSFTIRAYFLHTLVFRFGHITDFAAPPDDPDNASATRIAHLFHERLDSVRARYEELLSDAGLGSTGSEPASRRSSIYSTIRTIVVGPSAHVAIDSDTDASRSNDSLLSASPVGTPQSSSPSTFGKAERLLGIPPAGGGSLASLPSTEPSTKRRWFRSLGKKSKDAPQPHLPKSASEQPSSLAARRGARKGTRSSSTLSLASSPAFGGRKKSSSMRGGTGTTEHLATNASFDLQSERTLPAGGAPHLAFPTPDGPRGGPPRPPRVSREFAHRPSLVPGPAGDLVLAADAGSDDRPSAALPRPSEVERQQAAFPPHLQPYAVQSLREYEQTVSEHDEFIASLPPDQRTDVPRLAVAWPAMWQGEQ